MTTTRLSDYEGRSVRLLCKHKGARYYHIGTIKPHHKHAGYYRIARGVSISDRPVIVAKTAIDALDERPLLVVDCTDT